jgi:hypothetical protein
MTDATDIIRMHKKGKHIKTLEKYHLHKITKNNLHMNDISIDTYNPISSTVQDVEKSIQIQNK